MAAKAGQGRKRRVQREEDFLLTRSVLWALRGSWLDYESDLELE